MGYCTVDEVRNSIGNLDETEVSTTDIEDIIEEASSFMDSYIAVQYLLPLTTPYPPILERICRNLSACWLYDDIIASGLVIEERYKTKTRCEKAVDMLKDIRDGKIVLIYPDGTEVSQEDNRNSKPWTNTSDYSHPQFFDKDDEMNWAFNTNELKDISSERE